MYPKICRAAVITEITDLDRDRVALFVMNPTGLFFHERCEYHTPSDQPENMVPGSWHWPERIE